MNQKRLYFLSAFCLNEKRKRNKEEKKDENNSTVQF